MESRQLLRGILFIREVYCVDYSGDDDRQPGLMGDKLRINVTIRVGRFVE